MRVRPEKNGKLFGRSQILDRVAADSPRGLSLAKELLDGVVAEAASVMLDVGVGEAVFCRDVGGVGTKEGDVKLSRARLEVRSWQEERGVGGGVDLHLLG